MVVMKIFEMKCTVVDAARNEDFEKVLAILMIPIKDFDESTNTYTVHVTYKMWSYILRECRFRSITLQFGKKVVVNDAAYRSYKAEYRLGKILSLEIEVDKNK